MQDQQFKSAQNYFSRATKLISGDSKLAYYQGFIAYQLDQKDIAISFLNGVGEESEFRTSAKFFLAKIKLDNKEYTAVINLAQSELSDDRSVTSSAFYQIIGEAYALQNQANKASNYFEKAINLHPAQPSAALYYQAGVANFKINLKVRAVEYLTKSGIRSGEYAHLSAFQLARLYVTSDELGKATAAYIEATTSIDSVIREESLFKAGKLLIGHGNYSEGINYLQDYRDEFSAGQWVAEAEGLLAEAFLRSSNYDLAINHLNEIGISSESHKRIYQKATFHKAILFFGVSL